MKSQVKANPEKKVLQVDGQIDGQTGRQMDRQTDEWTELNS